MQDFYQQPTPDTQSAPNYQTAVNQGQDYAKMMARLLMTKGQGQPGQGTPMGAPGEMVQGHYVPPSTASYINQLAGGALRIGMGGI